MLESLCAGLLVAVIGLVLFLRRVNRELGLDIEWTSDVTVEQLQQHQAFYLALLERVHLDPGVRKALRHQHEILRSIGVVTCSESYQASEQRQLTIIPEHKNIGVNLDEWNEKRGYKTTESKD